ncbi:hypothetical protein OCV88_00100 [Brotonthovivens ammoniilytica]|uniref:Uncharacterized protein n=1 Tax=Brotonthovivens ammoniilytica TaxID=2981725 RepID=A0ABT2TEX8_9FIRM|nr:hypothetical protein [Brotonthovivens ammoniilytica]MCU6760733.1 hypothetical protein [Brotonthovivens ammoniilytica]
MKKDNKQKEPQKQQDPKQKKFFYQLIGAGIVVVIFAIIGIVSGLK